VIVVRTLQVAVALGLLIFVHELGHFLAAKLAGVRVLVFSFGFGPFLFSFRRGETIYALSLVPFGGYVRMTGQADVGRVSEEEKHAPFSYMAKPPRWRAAIIAAGVAMNAVFAYLLFLAACVIGFPVVSPEIGFVAPNSPAEKAGLRPGDRILEVNGRAVDRFFTIQTIIATGREGRPVALKVRRPGLEEALALEAVPVRDERDLLTIGVSPVEEVRLRIGARNESGLGVLDVNEGEPAEKAGLRPWDRIVSLNGAPTTSVEAFRAELQRSGAGEVELGIVRAGETLSLRASPAPKVLEGNEGKTVYLLGLKLTEQIVGEIEPGSPAEAAGLRRGDYLAEVLRTPGSRRVEIAWRGPGGRKGRAVLEQMDSGPVFLAGMDNRQELMRTGLLGAPWGAAREFGLALRVTAETLWGLLSLRVSPRHLSGPVSIVAMTHSSTKAGWGFYMWFVALISVNLVVINLFPMLPLDGGLLMFLLYEGLRGRPASPRVQEIAQIVGVVLLVALIVLVTQNDIRSLI